MRNISFAWTTPALMARAKTCTRREWDAGYAAGFRAGDLVAAYNRLPRFKGEQVATIRLLQAPSFEPMAAMPDSDYEAEGFAWLIQHPELMGKTIDGLPRNHFMRWVLTPEGFNRWRNGGGAMWVVRFEIALLVEQVAAKADADRDDEADE